jgi:hypothetical protein
VQSTPSFVIGDELVTGAMEPARFEELISKSRSRDGDSVGRPGLN